MWEKIDRKNMTGVKTTRSMKHLGGSEVRSKLPLCSSSQMRMTSRSYS